MTRNKVLQISSFIMLALGIIMILLGAFSSAKLLLPPLITGIGFLITAWVFNKLSES